MSTAQLRESDATTSVGKLDVKLEVIIIPVSDVDRAKQFYEGLGWRIDYQVTPEFPDRRRATLHKEVRPPGRQPQSESARRPVGTFSSASDITDNPDRNSKLQIESGANAGDGGRSMHGTSTLRSKGAC